MATTNTAPTFASAAGTGKLLVSVGNGYAEGGSVILQSDGKIVVAGSSDFDFSLIRLNADGTLDTSFGGNGTGKLIVPVGSDRDSGRSVILQSDGKIIVAGVSNNGSNEDFGLIRLNTDGTLDPGFGSNGTGKLLVPVGSWYDVGSGVALQSDGKIIVAGTSDSSGDLDFSLIRLNADGTLDPHFGGNGTGKLIVPVGSGLDWGSSVTLQSDGKIVVAGTSDNGRGLTGFSLIRLNTDGSLDTGFGAAGKLIVSVGSGGAGASSVVLQPDGRIVVAGTSDNDFGLIRLNADGTLDTSFGGQGTGRLIMSVGSGRDVGSSVILQSDGKMVVAGTSDNGSNTDFSLIRLNPDGTLDTGFGGQGTGKLLVPVSSSGRDWASSVALQPDGKIVVAGTSDNDFGLIRLNPDGTLDTSFAAPSTLDNAVAYTENAPPVLLDGSVAIFDAELAAQGHYGGSSITLARSGGANAQDVFGATGNLVFASNGDAVLSGTAIGSHAQSGGTLVIDFNDQATQTRINEALSALTYANTSDAPPASVTIGWTFNDGNQGGQGSGGAQVGTASTVVHITSVNDAPVIGNTAVSKTLVQNSFQSFVAADFGFTDVDTGDTLQSVTIVSAPLAGELFIDADQDGVRGAGERALGDGAQVDAADIDQLVFRPAADAVGNDYAGFTWTVSDGIADSANEGTMTLHVASAANTANTAPIFASAAGTGKLLVPVGNSRDEGHSAILQPDGKIVVVGGSDNGSNNDFGLIRLNADGTLDTSFGGNGTGKLLVPVGSSGDWAYSVALQSDGKIVVAGSSDNGSNNDFSLIRLNTDGTLDTHFGGQGTGRLMVPVSNNADDAHSVVLQADGKIVVAGVSFNGSNNDFSLIRLNTDGTLDPYFGSQGTGRLMVPVSSNADVAYSVVLQTDGKIVVAGGSDTGSGSNKDFSLIRLNTDGTLDTSFGGNGTGTLIVPVGGGSGGRGITLQPDGKMVVAGGSDSGSNKDFSLIRLNADGTLDTSFGGNGTGKLLVPVGNRDDWGGSVALQPDGKIVVAGSAHNGSYFDVGLIRLHANGTLDTSFGSNGTGKLIVSVGSASAVGKSVILQPDGKIVVAGVGGNGSNSDFGLIRVNPDGTLDTSFGVPTTLDNAVAYTENAPPVLLDGSVAIFDAELAAQGHYGGSSVTLARSGGANAQDVFDATGNLVFASNGDVMLSSTLIGSHAQSAGTLTIHFNDQATQTRINEALSALTYANTSDAPPASVTIGWTFSDGNTGGQGSGGARVGTGSTVVHITSVNDAPVIGHTAVSKTLAQNSFQTFAAADFGFTDVDTGDTLQSVTIVSAPLAGELFIDADQDGMRGAGEAVLGDGALVDAADIDQLVFRPAADASGNGYAQFTWTVSDGTADSANTGTMTLHVASAAAPTPPPAPKPPPAPTPPPSIAPPEGPTEPVEPTPPQPPSPPPHPEEAPTPTAPAPATVIVDGMPVSRTILPDGSVRTTVPVVSGDRVDTIGSPDTADIPLVMESAGQLLLDVGVPLGVGITAEGFASPQVAPAALASLIAHLQRVDGSNTPWVSDGNAFLATLPPTATLAVQKLTLTAPSGAIPAVPIRITGSASSSHEAVVIDARSLASGTMLQAESIDFMAIAGSVRVTGSGGNSFATGDASAQWMVLGAGDDILHGGAGDDTVGSLGGNDQVFGDAGNDIVFGGTGHDTLSGGSGNDRLDGGLGWDTALQSGALADYTLRTEGPFLVLTNKATGEVDRLKSIETVQFDTGPNLYIADSDAEAALAHIATRWLGRAPTAEEGAWAQQNSQLSDVQVAQAALRSSQGAALQGKSAEELVAGWKANAQIVRMDTVPERVQGTAGLDQVGYGLRWTDVHLARTGTGRWEGTSLVDGDMAEFVGIERMRLNDVSVALDTQGTAGKAAALLAVTLGAGAISDKSLAGQALAALDAGMSVQALGEVALRYAQTQQSKQFTAQETVQWLWKNSTGSEGTQVQLQPYVQQLQAGQVSGGDLVNAAVQHALAYPSAQLVGVMDSGLLYST
ncbi:hypothetical protein [Delftia sp. PS-11]|uniref:hypothetical protein n=1 Tax=Delftia sp. PS-11 TaxID=2767222 RepID=UPI00245499CD|nr:hypothetical protein [Delftia sp. PS-11]KAJ8742183.1 hypothetical protein H9T68_20500 [Delftia sp. PS-11]